MIDRKNRWKIASWNEEREQTAAQLSKRFNIPLLVARLLIQRGFENENEIEQFLYGDKNQLHDPFLMADMTKAVERIQGAASSHEKVWIYGDYDADGVSSTTLLYYTFQALQMNFDYYIPHRVHEGYGLNKGAIDKAKQEGVTLIVTVDTGISAFEEVQYATELGIDIVVTDHHEPPEQLPHAIAIVNPKQEHCPYPFKGLAGVGVAFKLATALLGEAPIQWTDIVALGTVADLMPLMDENRILVKYGIERLKSGDHIGFKALATVSGIEYTEMASTQIGFSLAPRINAAGRLEHARTAVELLISNDEDAALGTAHQLDQLNKKRQQIVEDMVKEALSMWEQKCQHAKELHLEVPAVIVLAKEGWNVGVIGIVASKLLERYYKPVIILGIDPVTGLAKGSARSIEGFDIHHALTECSEMLEHYGGHQAAAGMTLKATLLDQLEQQLSNLAKQWVQEEEWIPSVHIDLECDISDANLHTISQLALLEPFGMGNTSPKVLIRGVQVADKRALGKESNHLKLLLKNRSAVLESIGFGFGHYANRLLKGTSVEVIGELSVNEWNQIRKAQFIIQDLQTVQEPLKVFPTREQFGMIYQCIRKQGKLSRAQAIGQLQQTSPALTSSQIAFILEVFKELQFIMVSDQWIEVVSAPEKKDLSSSLTYKRAKLNIEAEIS